MWHAEFLFAAAALLQQAIELSKIVIVQTPQEKAQMENMKLMRKKGTTDRIFSKWPNSISLSKQQQSSCCHIHGQLL